MRTCNKHHTDVYLHRRDISYKERAMSSKAQWPEVQVRLPDKLQVQ